MLSVSIEVDVRRGELRQGVNVCEELLFGGGTESGLLECTIVRNGAPKPANQLFELAQGVRARTYLESSRVLLANVMKPCRDVLAARIDRRGAFAEGGDLREDPWVSHRGASHHRRYTSGLFRDAKRVGGIPDVAVADDGDAELLREDANDAPIRDAFVEVAAPARVNGDEVGAGVLDDSGDGHYVFGIIEPCADLCGELRAEAECVQRLPHLAEHSLQEFRVLEHRRAHTLPNDARHRTAKVDVDDVRARSGDMRGGVGHLVGVVAHHLHGQWDARNLHDAARQRRTGDRCTGDTNKLRTQEVDSASFGDETAECGVAHAFHRREDRKEREVRHSAFVGDGAGSCHRSCAFSPELCRFF